MAAPLVAVLGRATAGKITIGSCNRCTLCVRWAATKSERPRAFGQSKQGGEWAQARPRKAGAGSFPAPGRRPPTPFAAAASFSRDRVAPSYAKREAAPQSRAAPTPKNVVSRSSGRPDHVAEQTETAQPQGLRQRTSRPDTATGPPRSEVSKSSANVGSEAIEYEFLEDSSKKISAAFLAAKSRKEREKSGVILLEGNRLVKEAFTAGLKLKELFFSGSAAEVLQEFQPAWLRGQLIYKVRYQCLKSWSDVQTPQGVCGFFLMPPNEANVVKNGSPLPLTVICDNIAEPGNMGAIIRSAAAAGCERLVATKGCVSIWEPKVIRAAAGGHFHVPILLDQSWEQVNAVITTDYSVYLASSSAELDRKSNSLQRNRQALDLLLEGADNEETVLDKPGEESKAGNTKQGRISDSHEDDDEDEGNEADVEKYRLAPLATSSYCDISYAAGTGKHVALVIGGETHGLSAYAHKLAFDRYGCRVHVPMAPNVDSLNSAVAVGVLLFEVRRQLASVRR